MNKQAVDNLIEAATREAGLRSQNTLLTQQYNAIHSTLVRYAEAMGRLIGLARPVVAAYDKWRGKTFTFRKLPMDLQDHLDAFAKELNQLVRKEPKDGTQEKSGTDVEGEPGQAQEGATPPVEEGAPGAKGAEAPPEA